MKEFEDDNFRFDENCREPSRLVENTVGKEEIAHYEQFLLFPQCFQKDLYCRYVKTRACLAKHMYVKELNPDKHQYMYSQNTFTVDHNENIHR